MRGACREVIIIIWLVSAAGNGGLFAARITLSAIYGDTMEKREGLRSKQRGKKEALYGKGHGGLNSISHNGGDMLLGS